MTERSVGERELELLARLERAGHEAGVRRDHRSGRIGVVDPDDGAAGLGDWPRRVESVGADVHGHRGRRRLGRARGVRPEHKQGSRCRAPRPRAGPAGSGPRAPRSHPCWARQEPLLRRTSATTTEVRTRAGLDATFGRDCYTPERSGCARSPGRGRRSRRGPAPLRARPSATATTNRSRTLWAVPIRIARSKPTDQFST